MQALFLIFTLLLLLPPSFVSLLKCCFSKIVFCLLAQIGEFSSGVVFFFSAKYDTESEASILFKKHAVKLYLGLEISPNIPLLDLYSCLWVIWICGLSSHILIKQKISTCTFAGL